ncbi:hypothetical protein Taro_011644 [Colocasia esculenta]|uniref:Transposase n=1 Tax=Colocasia esculenta TaxID=4460 RepID=A0A843UAK6_COLES|nr:hypothetical protein [Colocasia esculenta]
MTALADEMKVIDLHVPKLTADWFSREEYEKFRENLQGKIIHIDAQSASTSKKVKRGPTLLRSIHGLQSNERIPVNFNQLGQPLGEGGQLLKQFLGTVARMWDKLPIDCISWRVMPSFNKDDVLDYIQRKFDVPISLRDFVMKDLDQKWRSWKYDLRTKFFTPYQRAQQHFACSDRRVVEDQWKKLVQIWSSEEFKDKIRDIKLTQQSTTSSSIASVRDAYEQVMGRDKTGRICGIGTGPTPKSLWGSRSEQKLRQDNESLKEKIEALEERMKKIEYRGNNESSASVCHAQKKKKLSPFKSMASSSNSGSVGGYIAELLTAEQ